jgi:hypothetical protein
MGRNRWEGKIAKGFSERMGIGQGFAGMVWMGRDKGDKLMGRE